VTALAFLIAAVVGAALGLAVGPDADGEHSETEPVTPERFARDETAFVNDPDFAALARGRRHQT
jgi:hypothetical protein